MLRLSVIVPFYNVEPYIEQCIRSLYDQDIPEEEYEVICVDDCSPDNSREIVKEYQKKHKNLILIEHERNKKLGGARNTGLRAAKGEYVWFVDSDDYIAKNCMGKLLSEAERQDVEVLLFNYQNVQDGKSTVVSYPAIKEGVTDGIGLLEQIYDGWYYGIPTAWNKLYLREFLVKNGLFFEDDVMYEDTDWSLTLLSYVKRISYLPYVAYNYRRNGDSITIASPTAEKMVFTILQQNRCALLYQRLEENKLSKLIRKYVTSQLTCLRLEIKSLSANQKLRYRQLMKNHDIKPLYKFSNWRTWMAIRYGLTWFVKC